MQERPRGSTNDLEWTPAGDPVELPSYTGGSSDAVWAGAAPRPANVDASQKEYRLLVREVERHVTDADVAVGATAFVPYGERLVYAAELALRF